MVETFRKIHWVVYGDGQVAVSDLDFLFGKQGGCLDCRVVETTSGERRFGFFYRSPHGFFLDVSSDSHSGLHNRKTEKAANKFLNDFRAKFTIPSDYQFVPDLETTSVLEPGSLRSRSSMKAAIATLDALFSSE